MGSVAKPRPLMRLFLRLLFSVFVGGLAVLIVSLVSLPFMNPCPLSEIGTGLVLCFNPPAWLGPVQFLVLVAIGAFGWWSSRYWFIPAEDPQREVAARAHSEGPIER